MVAGVSPISPLVSSSASKTEYRATAVSPAVVKATAFNVKQPHPIGEVEDMSPAPPQDIYGSSVNIKV